MPSRSIAQSRLAGADLGRLREGKKTRTGMSKKQLEEFAATKERGLPTRITRDYVKKRLKQKMGS